MAELLEQSPEDAEAYYRKIFSYRENEHRTGFREWMVQPAITEYLDRYFSHVLPYDMVVDEVEDGV